MIATGTAATYHGLPAAILIRIAAALKLYWGQGDLAAIQQPRSEMIDEQVGDGQCLNHRLLCANLVVPPRPSSEE